MTDSNNFYTSLYVNENRSHDILQFTMLFSNVFLYHAVMYRISDRINRELHFGYFRPEDYEMYLRMNYGKEKIRF